jgi:hypothetical protein
MAKRVVPAATHLSLVVGVPFHADAVADFLHADALSPSAIVQKIGFDKIESELAGIGAELDRLLGAVPPPAGSYQLSSIQLSLGVTANGGIGIVTAGLQAGISLTFSPKDPSDPGGADVAFTASRIHQEPMATPPANSSKNESRCSE